MLRLLALILFAGVLIVVLAVDPLGIGPVARIAVAITIGVIATFGDLAGVLARALNRPEG